MDHLERAYRREELPLLAADYERQKAADRENHMRAYRAQVAAARERHERDLAAKKTLARVVPDYEGLREKLLGKRRAEHAERCREAEVLIEQEKERRRADAIRAREEEERRRAAAEEARLAREKEEAARAERQRADAEREAQLEAQKRAEIEERQASLRRQSDMQAAQEARAAERLERSRQETASRIESDSWRRGPAPSSGSGSTDPMFANRRYRPGDLARSRGAGTGGPTAPPPTSARGPTAPPPSSGRYVPGAFSRMRQQQPPQPPAHVSGGSTSDADGFTQVKPRGSVYRPPGARDRGM